jgi:CMP-N-acetylneuraminic acid synthetase
LTVLALIPARGQSKGLPGKNIRPFCGRPLLGWSVLAARQSGVADRIVLSTDDPQIAAAGREQGALVPFLRPADIAADDTPMRAVIAHAIASESESGHAPDIVVLLQPTSPLRSPRQIRDAVSMLRETGCDSVVSVVAVPSHLCPDYVMTIADGTLRSFLPEGVHVRRRQDVRPAWYRDGSIYAFRRSTFETFGDIYGETCRPLVVDADRTGTIDTLADFEDAERRFSALVPDIYPELE